MWKQLSDEEKEAYRERIMMIATISPFFAQKSQDGDVVKPIVNSKFQETAFIDCFNGTEEDISNTSFDASVQTRGNKYLVGIKTFGKDSGNQKIAQFKAKLKEWSHLTNQMGKNAEGKQTKKEIDEVNRSLYYELAVNIANLRNERIESSKARLKGFKVSPTDADVSMVYHVLMPAIVDGKPYIFVGETDYTPIDIKHIQVEGCTSTNNPANFKFNDGRHHYSYTAADCQLYMDFDNEHIWLDRWPVTYQEKTTNTKKHPQPIESYSWLIPLKDGEVPLSSGFNNFYGTGSKLGQKQRLLKIKELKSKWAHAVPRDILENLCGKLAEYLELKPSTVSDKTVLRQQILGLATHPGELRSDVNKLVFRPMDEMYIPIHESRGFHDQHPDFFGKDIGTFKSGTSKLALPKDQRTFNLVFDPSGNVISSFVTQDNGKGIQSCEKQSYLGNWILREVFQLKPYEPLTTKKLNDIGINGFQLSKYAGSDDIHITFIWIDVNNPPANLVDKWVWKKQQK